MALAPPFFVFGGFAFLLILDGGAALVFGFDGRLPARRISPGSFQMWA